MSEDPFADVLALAVNRYGLQDKCCDNNSNPAYSKRATPGASKFPTEGSPCGEQPPSPIASAVLLIHSSLVASNFELVDTQSAASTLGCDISNLELTRTHSANSILDDGYMPDDESEGESVRAVASQFPPWAMPMLMTQEDHMDPVPSSKPLMKRARPDWALRIEELLSLPPPSLGKKVAGPVESTVAEVAQPIQDGAVKAHIIEENISKANWVYLWGEEATNFAENTVAVAFAHRKIKFFESAKVTDTLWIERVSEGLERRVVMSNLAADTDLEDLFFFLREHWQRYPHGGICLSRHRHPHYGTRIAYVDMYTKEEAEFVASILSGYIFCLRVRVTLAVNFRDEPANFVTVQFNRRNSREKELEMMAAFSNRFGWATYF
ncbi:hypothetical protein B0J11DRAFT_612148 [Dendryphion nanum]|uniref:RRM domain-containing protein n=1 Tax=Dendryphion nanum TaxID=256645 RepID=A0A9P9IV65_9PLEO|nr:hypothetical protein B0J11DRAFT_612148 [Dendryphion nanum]